MYIPGESTDPGYDSTIGMVSTYPLSTFSTNWGWNLNNAVSGTDIIPFYNFWE